jgi:hypothetical protein
VFRLGKGDGLCHGVDYIIQADEVTAILALRRFGQ